MVNMKKLIALLLAAALALSLAACGGSKEVELTTDNIEEYLDFDFDYSKVDRQQKIGITFGYTDITCSTYAVQAGDFNNAEVTVEVSLNNGWEVSSSDTACDENNPETLVMTFRIPADGEYTETHDLIASLVFQDPDAQNISYNITSVSGTFTPSR